jgi:hypothetical protein
VSHLHVVPTAAAPPAAPSRPRPWLRGATLAAAATVGALVGFGLTDGASLSRLGVVALRLRGLPEFVSPDRGALGPALLGGVHAAVGGGAWGAALAALAGALRARGARGVVTGAALAAPRSPSPPRTPCSRCPFASRPGRSRAASACWWPCSSPPPRGPGRAWAAAPATERATA